MPPTHRKLRRKELKQPDEFLTLFDQAREFFVDNLKQVLVSAGIVLAAAALVIAVYSYERHRDELAGAQFSAALAALNAKNYKSAEQQFARLADAEPNRRVGRLARFYLATAYLGGNDLPRARDALVAFVAGEHDPIYSNLAMTDLGVVYEKMGDYAKAAGAYRASASVPGPEQEHAELDAARMLAKQGDRTEAIAAYRRFLAEHPYAAERQDVIESLAMLGAAPEGARTASAAGAGNLPVVMPPAEPPR
jgi:predicted negative regulator of RcsB-dependent stress response